MGLLRLYYYLYAQYQQPSFRLRLSWLLLCSYQEDNKLSRGISLFAEKDIFLYFLLFWSYIVAVKGLGWLPPPYKHIFVF